MDTTSWERKLAQLELEELLAWASQLAEQEVELQHPVRYIEAPLREVTTGRVSECARRYLGVIVSARIHRTSSGWGIFTPSWWWEREEEAFSAIRALRTAVAGSKGPGES